MTNDINLKWLLQSIIFLWLFLRSKHLFTHTRSSFPLLFWNVFPPRPCHMKPCHLVFTEYLHFLFPNQPHSSQVAEIAILPPKHTGFIHRYCNQRPNMRQVRNTVGLCLQLIAWLYRSPLLLWLIIHHYHSTVIIQHLFSFPLLLLYFSVQLKSLQCFSFSVSFSLTQKLFESNSGPRDVSRSEQHSWFWRPLFVCLQRPVRWTMVAVIARVTIRWLESAAAVLSASRCSRTARPAKVTYRTCSICSRLSLLHRESFSDTEYLSVHFTKVTSWRVHHSNEHGKDTTLITVVVRKPPSTLQVEYITVTATVYGFIQ